MAAQEREATVVWAGDLADGEGEVAGGSGALGTQKVSWSARTEAPGGKTSPEELIAAANASCFAMALSHALGEAGKPPERLVVRAVCRVDIGEDGLRISAMNLNVDARVPGMEYPEFEEAVHAAERGCPVSNALRGNVELHVSAGLERG